MGNTPNNRMGSKVKTGGGPDFDGLTPNPRKKETPNSSTGEVQGLCSRCGNFTSHLSDMGYCPNCDRWLEQNQKSSGQKKYIKAGSRKHVDL